MLFLFALTYLIVKRDFLRICSVRDISFMLTYGLLPILFASFEEISKNAVSESGLVPAPGGEIAAILVALNLWIALDSDGGSLGERLTCLIVPGSTCRGAVWIVPLLLWLGIALCTGVGPTRVITSPPTRNDAAWNCWSPLPPLTPARAAGPPGETSCTHAPFWTPRPKCCTPRRSWRRRS